MTASKRKKRGGKGGAAASEPKAEPEVTAPEPSEPADAIAATEPPPDRFAPYRGRLYTLSGGWPFRIAVAILLVAFHFVAFTAAAHSRLDMDFNAAPGEAPYYSNPNIGELQGYPRQPHRWSRLVLSRWDAQHSIGIALRGVSACPTDPATARDAEYMQCALAWMPATGLIAGAIDSVIGEPADVTLVAMSVLAALAINLLFTSRTVTSRLGRLESYMALLAFNLFPSAFYLVAPYNEAATFALALGGLVMLAKDRWVLAGLLVGASTGLRTAAVGFALGFGAAALVAAWQRRKAGTPQWWRPLAAAPLGAWGQFATMAYLWAKLGEPLANFRALHAFAAFNKDQSGLQFLRLLNPRFYVEGMSVQHHDGVVVAASLSLIALAGRDALRRFKSVEQAFLVVATLGMMAIPLAAKADYFWGINRYMLMAPLTFVAAGVVARKHTAVFIGWLLLSAAMYWSVELCSYVAQGAGSVCPCLGPKEFAMPFAS